MSIISEARKIRADFIKMRDGATDAVASSCLNLYPSLKGNGELIKTGTRILWNGALKRAATDLWDTAENNPDNAPALWENIEYRDGYRLIPEIITVGTAFMTGECGWWNDELYESLLDNNIWTPTAYPAGWKLIGDL